MTYLMLLRRAFHGPAFTRLVPMVLICLSAIDAQTPAGSFSGRVFDLSGSVVAGVLVDATEQATGRHHATHADATGRYRFLLLPVGSYKLSASAPGLHSDPTMVSLSVGQRWQVDIVLFLDTKVTKIHVSDATPLLDPENTSLGLVISRATIANIPVNEREFLQMSLLSVGAMPAAPGSELSRQNNSGLHVNGAREASNNFLLDGIDNNDLYINRLVVSPPMDSVREFRLYASGYRAEYGRSGGAQVNVVSRSGTNQLHGSIYEYLRNNAFDARNFFDNPDRPTPIFQRNQFGVLLGGPISRGKTFFFTGYEGTRVVDAITKTARVPDSASRKGDFSNLTVPVVDPFTQQPFPGNRIPAERIDPIAQELIARWPVPNRSGAVQNFSSAPRGELSVDQLYGRVDHYLNESNTFYSRYNFSDDKGFEPFSDGNTNIPGFGSLIFNRAQNFVVSATHFFSPLMVSELRLGFNRLRREVLQENIGKDIAGELGITGILSDRLFSGFPAINVSGFDSLSDNTALPIVRNDQTFHLVGNVTHVLGKHTLKWGGEHRYFTNEGIQAFFGRGQLNFLGTFTQNSIGDLLLGFPTFTIRTVIDNPFRQRASSWNGFIQDDWRISNHLNLSFGLRYEWNRPIIDAEDRFTTFNINSRQLVRVGADGLSRSGVRSDSNNFAPRLAMSWSPRAANDLILRVGWGVFYDTTILEANSGLYFNPPFFDLRLFFPSQNDLLTLSDPFPSGFGFTPPATVFTMEPGFRTAYLQQGNVSVAKTLSGNTVLRASYVVSKGTKLLRQRDLNQAIPGEGPAFLRQPIPAFANVITFESAASSTYHSGQFALERRFAQGLSFTLGYTIGKSIDDVSAFLATDGDSSFPQNSHNLRAERGLSTFDQRSRLVAAGSYLPPLGRHWLTKDWRLDLIAAFQTGTPLTPQLGFDNSNTGNTGAITGVDRPNLIGHPKVESPTPEHFFNREAFAIPAPFTFGNAGRNILTGPGSASVDVSLGRIFHLGTTARLHLRIEAFNIFNRTNFDLPGRIIDQPNFGVIASARSARQIQLSLRLGF